MNSEYTLEVNSEYEDILNEDILGFWLVQSASFRAQNDIGSADGCLRFVVWWYVFHSHRVRNHELRVWIESQLSSEIIESSIKTDAFPDLIFSFQTIMKNDVQWGILALFVWHFRDDLRNAFSLSTEEEVDAYLWWYLCDAQMKYLKSYDWSKRTVNASAKALDQSDSIHISSLMFQVFRYRKDLLSLFDLSMEKGRSDFIEWWLSNREEVLGNLGVDDSYWMDRFKKEIEYSYPSKKLNIRSTNLVEPQEQSCISDVLTTSSIAFLREDGVNLIGIAKGELGIGEDVRTVASALVSLGINVRIYNYDKISSSRQNDLSLAGLISEEFPYRTNIFCLPAIDYLRCFYDIGSHFFKGKYNIGFWPWEFPDYPLSFKKALIGKVDEIWAPSAHVAKAAFGFGKPVRVMPLGVSVDRISEQSRSYFGLSDRDFLFLFVFDGNSSFARKNPIACIRAFQKAFSKKFKDVGLVIKVMNAEGNPDFEVIQREVSSDSRIVLINKIMDRSETLALIKSCDAFVSLHRSEGFGRGIAEAMMLERSVIVSAYSGNMDFTNEQTAFLVEGDIELVDIGEYPFAQGLPWLNPSIERAAEMMRDCFKNTRKAQDLVRSAKILVDTKYSLASVAKSYGDRLKELGMVKL